MLAWPGASMRTQQGEVEVYGYRKGGGKMIVSIDMEQATQAFVS